jgi:hypothetical protein
MVAVAARLAGYGATRVISRATIIIVRSPSRGEDNDHQLDEVRWGILCEAVVAAHDGNPAAARAAWNRLETDVPAEGQASAYLWYLLRYRIHNYFGRRPTEQDLAGLAQRRHPLYARVLRGDTGELEDVLRTVTNMISENRRITGGRFVVFSIVTLGILLDDPQSQLDQMKPHLADWWQRRGWELVNDSGQAGDPDSKGL